MRDRILITLILVAVLLYLGHSVDHVIRGDVPLAPTPATLGFVAATALICAMVGVALVLYFRDKIGPRFWAIAALMAAAFGWLAHFSPFTEQPPRHILNAYRSAAAGWLALGCLIALMLTLVAIAIYAGWLWLRRAEAAPSR